MCSYYKVIFYSTTYIIYLLYSYGLCLLSNEGPMLHLVLNIFLNDSLQFNINYYNNIRIPGPLFNVGARIFNVSLYILSNYRSDGLLGRKICLTMNKTSLLLCALPGAWLVPRVLVLGQDLASTGIYQKKSDLAGSLPLTHLLDSPLSV